MSCPNCPPIWSEANFISAEANNIGEIYNQYIYLNDLPIAKLEQQNIFAIHSDHLGTPRQVTNNKKEIVWGASYAPFGEINIDKQIITLNLRFSGQYEDKETGMNYNYLRDYDPQTGRYTTSDPIGLKGGINTYTYVGGNPFAYVDPLGLAVFIFDRDLDGIFIGRHKYLVLVPDNPSDFRSKSYTIGNYSMSLQNLGDGTLGFVIGAQNTNGRLIAEPFANADYTATKEFYNPSQYTKKWTPDFSATNSLCTPNSTSGTRTDTQIIEEIIFLIQNYATNENSLNIRYPSIFQQTKADDGYVNSNSWAHTLADIANLNVAKGRNWSGADALHQNSLDHGYFTSSPNLNTIDAHNIDTDGDGKLDNRDSDDDGDGVNDTLDPDRRDKNKK